MLQLLTNKGLLFSLLLILNLAAFFLFKSNPRFSRGPIYVLLFLVFGFVIYRHLISPAILNQIETERKASSTTIQPNTSDLEGQGIQFTDRIIKNKLTALALFYSACWQVLFIIVFALSGLIFTDDKKTYLAYGLFFLFIGACILYALNT